MAKIFYGCLNKTSMIQNIDINNHIIYEHDFSINNQQKQSVHTIYTDFVKLPNSGWFELYKPTARPWVTLVVGKEVDEVGHTYGRSLYFDASDNAPTIEDARLYWALKGLKGGIITQTDAHTFEWVSDKQAPYTQKAEVRVPLLGRRK